MRIDDVIYFSPEHRAVDVDFENTDMLIAIFQSRIESYYFAPISLLIKVGQNNAFAAGVLIVSAIDAITNYSIGGPNRIKKFFAGLSDFHEFDNHERLRLGNNFDQYFRTGLVHEGRIKNAGQFSYAYSRLLFEEHSFMIINPKRLQDRLEAYFYNYLQDLRGGNAEIFKNKFRRQFETEVAALRQHYR